MKLKKGLKLILIKTEIMAAKLDAVCVVTEDYDHRKDKYVNVKWTCRRANSQMDGRYAPNFFRICTPLDEALE